MLGRTRIALLAGVFAIGISGCGSSDNGTIPMQNSENLMNLLAGVQSNISSGNCEVAVGQAKELTDAVNNLPSDVDSDVLNALTKGAANLSQLTASDCTEGGASGPSATDTTDTLSTTSTPTTTTESTTTTTPEETTSPENTGEAPPTNDGQGQGPPTPPGSGPGIPPTDGSNGGSPSGGVNPPGGKR